MFDFIRKRLDDWICKRDPAIYAMLRLGENLTDLSPILYHSRICSSMTLYERKIFDFGGRLSISHNYQSEDNPIPILNSWTARASICKLYKMEHISYFNSNNSIYQLGYARPDKGHIIYMTDAGTIFHGITCVSSAPDWATGRYPNGTAL